jgi:hypothetical protein
MDINNLTPIQQQALMLLNQSNMPDEIKHVWFLSLDVIPEDRIFKMMQLLQKEQDIKTGKMELSQEELFKFKRRASEIKKNAFKEAESEESVDDFESILNQIA